MAEYYAVERSPEYLMHYGVKGMKWGVRKAKESGSDRKLWRQYRKAQKKLLKLSANADVAKQKNKENDFERRAKMHRNAGRLGLGLALAGTGAGHLTERAYKALKNKHIQDIADMGNLYGKAQKKAQEYVATNHERILKEKLTPEKLLKEQLLEEKHIRENILGPAKAQNQHMYDEYDKAWSKNRDAAELSDIARNTGIGIALGGYGMYGVNKLRAHNARKRQTPEGHKAAIAQRDAWQREMKKAFKGTQYANSVRPGDYGKEYYKRYKDKIDAAEARRKRKDAAAEARRNRKNRETYVTLDLRSRKRRAAAGATGGRITVSHKPPKGYRRR